MRLFRRKKRHVHTWTKWETVSMKGVLTKSGTPLSWDAQQRVCTECGYMQRESL